MVGHGVIPVDLYSRLPPLERTRFRNALSQHNREAKKPLLTVAAVTSLMADFEAATLHWAADDMAQNVHSVPGKVTAALNNLIDLIRFVETASVSELRVFEKFIYHSDQKFLLPLWSLPELDGYWLSAANVRQRKGRRPPDHSLTWLIDTILEDWTLHLDRKVNQTNEPSSTFSSIDEFFQLMERYPPVGPGGSIQAHLSAKLPSLVKRIRDPLGLAIGAIAKKPRNPER